MDEKRTEQLRECEGVGEKVLRKTFGVDANAQIGMYFLRHSMYLLMCS